MSRLKVCQILWLLGWLFPQLAVRVGVGCSPHLTRGCWRRGLGVVLPSMRLVYAAHGKAEGSAPPPHIQKWQQCGVKRLVSTWPAAGIMSSALPDDTWDTPEPLCCSGQPRGTLLWLNIKNIGTSPMLVQSKVKFFISNNTWEFPCQRTFPLDLSCCPVTPLWFINDVEGLSHKCGPHVVYKSHCSEYFVSKDADRILKYPSKRKTTSNTCKILYKQFP